MDGQLIPLESVNAVEVFTGHKLDDLLARIRQETVTLVPDVSTATGRKEIASLAYKVARSKTTIDDAGKTLVAEWKARAAEVDAARKKSRDFLDALREEVRKPLDEWEAEQARIEREAAEKIEAERKVAEAARLAEIEAREREIREREEAIAARERAEQERIAAQKAEQERKLREEVIRKEAQESAKREAQEAIERAACEAEQAKEQARLVAERAQRETKEAVAKAEREKQEAVRQAELRARKEAEDSERIRLAEEARIKAEEARRAADRERRKTINLGAAAAFEKSGFDAVVAKKIVTLIASGQIPAVTINY